jgi:hypothetical protein
MQTEHECASCNRHSLLAPQDDRGITADWLLGAWLLRSQTRWNADAAHDAVAAAAVLLHASVAGLRVGVIHVWSRRLSVPYSSRLLQQETQASG